MQPIALFFALLCFEAHADDAYRLWLKYDLLQDASKRASYSKSINGVYASQESPTISVAVEELQMGLKGLLGKNITLVKSMDSKGGKIVLKIENNEKLSEEGYRIFSQNGNFYISAKNEKGLLYGSYEFLRQVQTLQDLSRINIESNPKIQLRLLNHWDNPNGTIERGYAGASLWKWHELPYVIDPRYKDYARANASIGINGTVLNNVNASARFMTVEYLEKVEALAKVFRPYQIKVFLSVRFSAPRNVGGLPTADPLDPQVRQWWKDKAKEIYSIIPDFGGFVVKANSEGEPGPQDYNRTHVDGANMLAEALEPFNGIVMWRAFVYKADPNGDRTKEAYYEFKPFDGQFHKNVIVQVKNGPLDFQPREPFHPLFGAMPQTPLMMEFQLTQEYLGFATHLVYEAPMFKEVLDADTYAKGKGSTVAKVIDGSLHNYRFSAMCGVANTGSDRNWTGHPIGQANWYTLGRLAWDYSLSSEQIAEEWIKMTLTTQSKAVATIKDMMLKSREVMVNYMTPLGLHHLMGEGIHYGPQPWLDKSGRPDWTSTYYHRADSIGLGFNRSATGSNAVGLYAHEIQAVWGSEENCPLEFLLWFHHIRWDKKLSSGKTLWDELCLRYYGGAEEVKKMQEQWISIKPFIDKEIFTDVLGRLQIQHREAVWWRDACVLYFQTFSKKPIPEPLEKPKTTLEELKKLVLIYQMR
ncbi:MAG: alpha-glucuronidase family glycosyl hydrolase [Thermoflexibacter sp.]